MISKKANDAKHETPTENTAFMKIPPGCALNRAYTLARTDQPRKPLPSPRSDDGQMTVGLFRTELQTPGAGINLQAA
jgi:hypothetical protein